MPSAKDIPEARWEVAKDQFELGYVHASALAQALGVSPQTVGREMRKRGAVKGSRANETVRELERTLILQAEARARIRIQRDMLLCQYVEDSLTILNRMMNAIIDADRAGDLTMANSVIAETAGAFGGERRGSSRCPRRTEKS